MRLGGAKNMIRARNIDPVLMAQINAGGSPTTVPLPGNMRYVSIAGGEMDQFFKDNLPGDQIHGTITEALQNAQANQNDTIILSPDSHTQGSNLLWNKNLTHLVGNFHPAMVNQRARIGHNANFDKLLTLNGWGCSFMNLYFMYGRGASATNVTCLDLPNGYDRNAFIRCHFNVTDAATMNSAADYFVLIGSDEHYFQHCTFGGSGVAITAGQLVRFAVGSNGNCVFEDCLFQFRGDADTYFMGFEEGMGVGTTWIKRCMFSNMSSTASADAVYSNGLATTGQRMFLIDSYFSGVTDIGVNGYQDAIFIGAGSCNTANDEKVSAIAQNPVDS